MEVFQYIQMQPKTFILTLKFMMLGQTGYFVVGVGAIVLVMCGPHFEAVMLHRIGTTHSVFGWCALDFCLSPDGGSVSAARLRGRGTWGFRPLADETDADKSTFILIENDQRVFNEAKISNGIIFGGVKS